MRIFWKAFLASLLAIFVSSILFMFVLMGIVSAIASFSEKQVIVKSQSLLVIKLDNRIVERKSNNPFDELEIPGFSTTSTTGLNQIFNVIDKAKTDDNIEGIFLELSDIESGYATIEEIRNALKDFQSSGKFIYAYGDYYTQKGYYLSTVADQIFINKLGSIDFKGMALKTMFFKGLLEKLEVDVQVVRHGEFKSAVEPFILDKMSEANREQMTVLASDIWNVLVSQVSVSRGISVDTLQLIANQLLCENAAACLKYNMIDSISYYSTYENALRNLIQIKTDKKINYVSVSEYRKSITTTTNETNIAVVYAVGDIIDGEGDENSIGSITFCKELRKAYTNDKVKAIVIRINSPGGSALASEAIWNEIELAKKAGKIIVTSMGDYAASGGYYIACNSDAIVAQPTTLTGSIGVFGLIPSVQKMLQNKLGITYDVVKTNEHADYDSGRLLNEYELAKIKISIEEIYELFTQRVATGRKMKIEEVYKIGEGRVWTGFRASDFWRGSSDFVDSQLER